MKKYTSVYLFLIFFIQNIYTDSFTYNSFNNHGVIGLVNMPTARFYDESSYGLTLYNGEPDQKITMTSYPYDWMEASFFIPIFKTGHIVHKPLIAFASRTTRIKVLILSLD